MAGTLSLMFMKAKDGISPPEAEVLNARLLRAQKRGLEEHVEYLLKKGAHVSTSGTGGLTVLMGAASMRQPGIVRILLAHGAHVNTAGPDGVTALMCAAGQGDFSSAMLLMEFGADLLQKDKSGRTAFDYACDADNWNGNLEWKLKAETDRAREAAAKAPPPPPPEEPPPFIADVTTGQAVSIARPLRLKSGAAP
ncbi:MAG: ankyrin repeat domain-containing protein [Alphaproteobacteria bacterium]